ncbi:hypothetical protein BZL29_8545 [Mycobacterium kansasii]|uniref:Uncharacterized protein n=1 Tax=Mycobacterium kansasii TaxID=1768 RepID=A0A1V3W9F5_MYCKA|nr:hypothetical protein BZL29_8545 [Mycobacterium kansasii]
MAAGRVELVRAVRAFADQHDPRVADQLFQVSDGGTPRERRCTLLITSAAVGAAGLITEMPEVGVANSRRTPRR